jgi:hypothetical protein
LKQARARDDKRILIDGGKGINAYSFLQWKYRLEQHHKDIDALIISHGDADHSKGLIPILNDKHVYVKSIYHNGIVMRSTGKKLGNVEKVNGKNMLIDLIDDLTVYEDRLDELNDDYQLWVSAVINAKNNIEDKGLEFTCIRADHLTPPLVLGDTKPVTIHFVNPINFGTSDDPRLRKLSKNSVTVNCNSVGIVLEYGNLRMLLCGDMNRTAESQFLKTWKDNPIQAQVFKANHHGSHDFSRKFLNSVQQWISVVSSGDDPDYAHPRANLLGSLGKYASAAMKEPLIFSTEIAATFKTVEVDSDEEGPQLYEKTIQGIIYVRSNGKWIASGRVYGKSKDQPNKWEWEKYAFNLLTGKKLSNNLEIK